MDTSSKRYYERLTRNNAALLLVDHQIGLFTGIRESMLRNSRTMSWGSPKRPRYWVSFNRRFLGLDDLSRL